MGPTASGKSGVAIKLAQEFGGEIISADSRQIYRGLNIGSGKVRGAWNVERGAFISENILHHLIDVAKPMEDFNVSHFKKLAEEKIQEILERKKVPIICGGTAFWIDTLTKNSDIPEVAPNEKLRAKLALKSVEQLFTQLKKLDPIRASNIDRQNKVRLIRAIEICKAIGKVPEKQTTLCHPELAYLSGRQVSGSREIPKQVRHDNEKYNFLEIGIEVPREILNAKIKKRLEERFKEPASTRGDDHSSTRGGGMITEVANLHKKGVSWKWLERIGLEYRWLSLFLRQKVSESQMHEKLYFAIIHYAKRQMTWLKRNPQIKWHSDYKKIEKEVQAFLK